MENRSEMERRRPGNSLVSSRFLCWLHNRVEPCDVHVFVTEALDVNPGARAQEEASMGMYRREEVIEGLLGARTREDAGEARAAADRYRLDHPTDLGVLAALERLEAREWKLPEDAGAKRARRRVAFGLALVAGALCLYLYGAATGLSVVFGAAMALEAAGWAYAFFASRSRERDTRSDRG